MIPTYSAKEFAWNGNAGVTEVSHLGHVSPISGQSSEMFGAITKQFIVRGKTRDMLFVFQEVVRDREGDLQSWKFLSECNKFKIAIYND